MTGDESLNAEWRMSVGVAAWRRADGGVEHWGLELYGRSRRRLEPRGVAGRPEEGASLDGRWSARRQDQG